MSLMKRLRRSPPICFLVGLGCLLTGRIRFSQDLLGKRLETGDGERFTIFRHMTRRVAPAPTTALFWVRFKFARFSHSTNKWLSLIPVLLIAGSPGFRDKIWLVNEETGCWLGLYQWESTAAVDAYKQSFVLGVMNRRAQADSVFYRVLPATSLQDLLMQTRAARDGAGPSGFDTLATSAATNHREQEGVDVVDLRPTDDASQPDAGAVDDLPPGMNRRDPAGHTAARKGLFDHLLPSQRNVAHNSGRATAAGRLPTVKLRYFCREMRAREGPLRLRRGL